MPFCQGEPGCGRLVPDAHGAQSACDDAAIDPIPIADEVVRASSQGKASVSWRATHSAVGFVVTWIQTGSLRSPGAHRPPAGGAPAHSTTYHATRRGLGRNRSLRCTPCDVGAVTRGDLNVKETMPHIVASRRHVDGAPRSAKSVFQTGSSARR
jgi:hypothetical protein